MLEIKAFLANTLLQCLRGDLKRSLVLSNPQRLLYVAINIPGSLSGKLTVSRQHIA